MVQVCLSWCWIGITALLWGYAGVRILNGKRNTNEYSLDLYFLFGIIFLTVFAEYFSLLYKVGGLANIILLLMDGIIVFVFRKDLFCILKDILGDKGNMYRMIIIVVLAILISSITSGKIQHYDTDLYHAQAVHWIEDYGIVPGLGNLHNRLAYNSSFFCLQALFSFKFLNGESLHSMNGFCVFILLSYAICSFKIFRDKKLHVSDFLRIGMIYLYTYRDNISVISSPGSDLLALGLVFYIFIKWVDYLEQGIESTEPYALLCLVSVYAVSVKLSTAMMVLLTIMPAIKLIRNRDWISIVKYIVIGLVIIMPFLIRNVIISGYLLYPYPELDLFNVDWKMPSYTLYFDRYEIQAWGRGLNDVFRFDASIDEWFIPWLIKLSQSMRIFFFATFILGGYGIVKSIYKGIKYKNWNYFIILLTAITCFIMWFIGAPLARYGSAFLLIVPLYVLGEFVCSHVHKYLKFITLIVTIIICCNMHTMLKYVIENPSYNLIESSEYEDFNCDIQLLGNEEIYIPVEDDRAGYYDFPSTPYGGRLELIELRGSELNSGFRIKEKYRDKNISTYGGVDDNNIFE